MTEPKRKKWTIEAMETFLKEHKFNGTIVRTWYEDYGYQKKLKAKILDYSTGNTESVIWNNFIRRKNFNAPIRHYWSLDDIVNFFDSLGYTLLDEKVEVGVGVGVDTPISFQNKQGFKFKRSISNIKQSISYGNKPCLENDLKNIASHNPFAQENIELYCRLYRPEYKFIDKYDKDCKKDYWFEYTGPLNNATIPRRFLCSLDYFINGNGGIRGRGLSYPAERIAGILTRDKINFTLEYSFKNSKISKYRFDFAIWEDNKLKLLLEYDSELHFSYIPGWHYSQQDFQAAQQRDREKNAYCLANHILLYRIPYWEVNNIVSFQDCLQDKFLVKSHWHNDKINPRLHPNN